MILVDGISVFGCLGEVNDKKFPVVLSFSQHEVFGVQVVVDV